MTKEEYIRLYDLFLAGRCSPEEEKRLREYDDEIDATKQHWDEGLMGDKQEIKEFIFSRLQASIQEPVYTKKSWFSAWYAAAAVALLVLSASIYLLLNRQGPGREPFASTKIQAAHPGMPGANKAILTLDDGSEIVLDQARNGTLSKQDKFRILKLKDGRLAYDATGTGGAAEQFNKIKTPRGGQYQIVLADGTKVWLNAASSLRFPAALSGKERRVSLRGEAYFEVAKNKDRPFLIEVNGMEVEVLGTHFNIMAYDDEEAVKTTLVEGSVKIKSQSKQVLLSPGQRAVLNKNKGEIKIAQVEVEEDIAWKNGVFIFNNEDIKSIMRKVSRWYDVDIRYEGNLDAKDFAGTVPRSEELAGVLQMLELTGAVHFKTQGRSVTVMP